MSIRSALHKLTAFVFDPRLPAFRLRQSSLDLAKCLYHFQQNIVLGIKDPDSEFSKRGTDFHALAHRYVEFLQNSHQESDWEYADELVESGDWNLEAVEIFKTWARSQSFQTETIFALEFKVRLDWDLNPVDESDPDAAKRIFYSGDFDRLDVRGTKATIRDYKTFFGVTKTTTIQAILYPYMLFHLMPYLEEIEFELEFVRWGIVSEPRTFTRDDLPMMTRFVKQQVARLVEAYQMDEWPAAVNSKCCYCHLSCPLVEAGLSQEAIGQVQTQERAIEMTQQLFALHQASTRLHANLKNWAMRSGTIDAGNDIMLGFKKTAKFQHDPKTIVSLNIAHGFEPTRALKPDNQEIERIARKYPEYQEAARITAKDKSITAFRFWNEAGDPLDAVEEDDE